MTTMMTMSAKGRNTSTSPNLMKGKISYWIQCALDQPSKGVAFVKAIQRSRQYLVRVDVDDGGLVEHQTRIEFA